MIWCFAWARSSHFDVTDRVKCNVGQIVKEQMTEHSTFFFSASSPTSIAGGVPVPLWVCACFTLMGCHSNLALKACMHNPYDVAIYTVHEICRRETRNADRHWHAVAPCWETGIASTGVSLDCKSYWN